MSNKWYEDLLETELEERVSGNIEAYALGRATSAQESAVRAFAEEQGFSNLRGFHFWLRGAGMDYYDVLKVQSPDDE